MPDFPSAIRSKLPNVGTTIFTVMSRLAAECGAINLSQGFPDFDPPPRLVDLVAEQMRRGVNQYAPMAGWPALLEAIAAKVADLYGCRVDPQASVTVQVTVVAPSGITVPTAGSWATVTAEQSVTVVPVTSNVERVYPFQARLPSEMTGLGRDSKAQAEQVKLRKDVENKAASNYTKVQEVGGLVGRLLLALLAVRILSRRNLLRLFQIPGLIILPVTFEATLDLDCGKKGYLTDVRLLELANLDNCMQNSCMTSCQ